MNQTHERTPPFACARKHKAFASLFVWRDDSSCSGVVFVVQDCIWNMFFTSFGVCVFNLKPHENVNFSSIAPSKLAESCSRLKAFPQKKAFVKVLDVSNPHLIWVFTYITLRSFDIMLVLVSNNFLSEWVWRVCFEAFLFLQQFESLRRLSCITLRSFDIMLAFSVSQPSFWVSLEFVFWNIYISSTKYQLFLPKARDAFFRAGTLKNKTCVNMRDPL